MSIFKSIMSKLGLGKKEDETPAAPARTEAPRQRTVIRQPSKEIPMVDVVSKLDGLAKANPAELNWKMSIVDLLKLLEIDSSFDNRKSLALELGIPSELLDDSAKMNTWLHKTVLQKIAENGGNVPASLLD